MGGCSADLGRKSPDGPERRDRLSRRRRRGRPDRRRPASPAARGPGCDVAPVRREDVDGSRPVRVWLPAPLDPKAAVPCGAQGRDHRTSAKNMFSIVAVRESTNACNIASASCDGAPLLLTVIASRALSFGASHRLGHRFRAERAAQRAQSNAGGIRDLDGVGRRIGKRQPSRRQHVNEKVRLAPHLIRGNG